MSEEITFYEFSSSEELLESYDDEIRYDIIFLDVEMAETSGIDAGIKIRTIDKKRLDSYIGHLSQKNLDGVNEALSISVGLHN